MEFGVILIVVLAVVGGIIAYLGDKIGSKVGKKRIRLFGMRPKNTSILVTVITGICIAAATIIVMAILSNNVRTALFGLDKLNKQMVVLAQQVNDKNDELDSNKSLLLKRTKELEKLNETIDEKNRAVANAKYEQFVIYNKLENVQEAFNKAQKNLAKSNKDINDLQATKDELDKNVRDLEDVKTRLQTTVIQLREGEVVFRVGEVLSGAIVKSGLKQDEYEYTIARILNDTNNLILRKMKLDEKKSMIFVSPDNVKDIAKKLAASKTPMLVRVIAAGNAVYGEPTVTTLVAQPYLKVYDRGEVVYAQRIQAGSDADSKILLFLQNVNKKAISKGVLANPLTGRVGDLSSNELYEVINTLRTNSGEYYVEAVTKEQVYTNGPLTITLRLHPLE